MATELRNGYFPLVSSSFVIIKKGEILDYRNFLMVLVRFYITCCDLAEIQRTPT